MRPMVTVSQNYLSKISIGKCPWISLNTTLTHSFIIKIALLTYNSQIDIGISGGWLFEIDPTLVHGCILVTNVLHDECGWLWGDAKVCSTVQRFVIGPMGAHSRGWLLLWTVRCLCVGCHRLRGACSHVIAETRKQKSIFVDRFFFFSKPISKHNIWDIIYANNTLIWY